MSDEESSNYYEGDSIDENINDLENLFNKKNQLNLFMRYANERLKQFKWDLQDQKAKIRTRKEEYNLLKAKRKRDKEKLNEFKKNVIRDYKNKKNEIIDIKRKLRNNLNLNIS